MEAAEALTVLGGVATAGELLRCTSRRKLGTAIETGSVVRAGPRRYCLPGLDDARAAAVRLGGVVSHLSAAQHWGWKLKLPPAKPCLTVPRRSCGLDADGVELHWADLEVVAVTRGVTDPLQTVVDCARTYDFDVALSVADSAVRSGIAREDIIEAAERSPRTGRGRAVRVATAADGRADNPFESVLRAIALEVGLAVEPQQWVGSVGRVDLLDRERRIVIEADSFEFHADRAALRRDVRRYTAFVRLGPGAAVHLGRRDVRPGVCVRGTDGHAGVIRLAMTAGAAAALPVANYVAGGDGAGVSTSSTTGHGVAALGVAVSGVRAGAWLRWMAATEEVRRRSWSESHSRTGMNTESAAPPRGNGTVSSTSACPTTSAAPRIRPRGGGPGADRSYPPAP